MQGFWTACAGWGGALLLLTAYALVSARKIDGASMAFQLMNIFGALGIACNSYSNEAYPSAMLNVIWIGIGAVALCRRRTPDTRGGRK